MDQIIKSLSQSLGLPEATVRNGVGILLNLLKQKAAESGHAQFTALVALLPGASDLMASTASDAASTGGGGGLGGLLAKAGGLLGGNLGGAAEALGALQSAGIPMDKVGDFATGFLHEAKSVAGEDAIQNALKNIPALASFLDSK